jgi:hypothetical protein
MNSELEIHDSTLAGIDTVGNDVVVRLAPAYIHRSVGRPGIDPGSGWLQDIDFVIREAVVASSPLQFPCWLSDGALSIGKTCWDNCFPLPVAASGAVTLSAMTEHGERLVIFGRGVETISHLGLQYVEQFRGASNL